MLRFLFCAILFSFSISHAVDPFSFSENHIYPVLHRGTDTHSGITFLSGALASVLTRSEDDHVRDQWRDHQKMSKNTSHSGDLFGSGALSVLAAGSQYLFDSNESHYQSELRGLAYGGLSIYFLKTAFGRNRPGGSDSHQSFPSGHTAIVFMTATHMAKAYGWPAGLAAFSIAGFTAASRWADDAHWFSDTVGGAFLGYYVGRATFYDSSEDFGGEAVSHKQKNFQIFPMIQANKYSLVTFVSF